VFRIRAYLIWIRILGSAHWITDPDPDVNPAPDVDPVLDPDPALFCSGCQDANRKLVIFLGFLTSVFKDIMSLRSHKTVEIMFFCFLMKQGA
jgi:hypothetical protein